MAKRLAALALTAILTATMLAACGSNKDNASEAPASNASGSAEGTNSKDPNSEAFEISVSSWILGSANAYAKGYMEGVEKLYKTKYPNAKIIWNPIQGEKYHELLKAQLAAKSAPDIFFHQNSLVPFARAGYLADLSDQPWANDILPSTWVENKYDGKVLAAPVDVSGWGVFYNKKIFDNLGLSIPTTYQEFLDLCEKIKASGVTPMTSGYKDGWPAAGTWISFSSFLYGMNKNIAQDLYDGKTKINGPEFKALFNAYEQMVQKGYLSKSILSTTNDLAIQELAEGKAAMGFNGPWVNSVVADKYKTDLGFFPIPDDKGNNFMTTSTNQSLSLNANYPNRQRGIDLINVLIDKSTLPGLLQNSAFTGLKGIEIPQNTTGGKAFADAIAKYESAVQITTWLPASTYDKLTQIITKITAGKGYTEADLNDVDAAYQKDKGLLNIIK
ncbi:ABC transporter substrate-binding protein [Cohnella soli]|uniref:ABC transporter substrate-binding protein n=1 Tax=Cohnella soli TaxID=425005 RepID=A0ABW0HMT4_9BACL